MNVFVGNLAYSTTEQELREAFERFGWVDSARIIIDRMTNRSRGFGFIEMADASEAQAAINGMDGVDMGGRQLRVNEARARRGWDRD